jgi:hypothetical protein
MLSDYLFRLFKSRISQPHSGAAGVFPPAGITIDLAVDCELLANILSDAYQNPSLCYSAHAFIF